MLNSVSVAALALGTSLYGVSARLIDPPIPYGHRGASAAYPENTILASEMSIVAGASVEIDIQVSNDGEVVVIHDSTVTRTTNGTGSVNNLRWEDYMEYLDAGSWKGAEFQGIKLPLLGEFLEWFEGMLALPGNSEYELMLDTKNVRPLIVPQIADIMKGFDLNDNVVMGCWNDDCLAQCQDLIPDVKVYVIGSLAPSFGWDQYRSQGVYGFHLNHNFLSASAVSLIQSENFPVYCWTVNSNNDIIRALQTYDVDGVFGDYPERIVAAIDADKAGLVLSEVEETEERPFADTRASAVAGACLNLHRFGPFFKSRPSPMEIFLQASTHCQRVMAACQSAEDASTQCVKEAQRLQGSFDAAFFA